MFDMTTWANCEKIVTWKNLSPNRTLLKVRFVAASGLHWPATLRRKEHVFCFARFGRDMLFDLFVFFALRITVSTMNLAK